MVNELPLLLCFNKNCRTLVIESPGAESKKTARNEQGWLPIATTGAQRPRNWPAPPIVRSHFRA
jgi:hypothetical protein